MFRKFLIDGDNSLERCGMFIGVPDSVHDQPPRRVRIVELPNRSATPADAYRVTQPDVLHALTRRGLTFADVVGFWHTHPHPYLAGPSQADIDSIMLGNRSWWHCVVHIESWTLTWYDYFDNHIEEHDDARNHIRPRPEARMARIRESRTGRPLLADQRQLVSE